MLEQVWASYFQGREVLMFYHTKTYRTIKSFQLWSSGWVRPTNWGSASSVHIHLAICGIVKYAGTFHTQGSNDRRILTLSFCLSRLYAILIAESGLEGCYENNQCPGVSHLPFSPVQSVQTHYYSLKDEEHLERRQACPNLFVTPTNR